MKPPINAARPIGPKLRVEVMKARMEKLERELELYRYLQALVKTPTIKRRISISRRNLVRISEALWSAAKRPDA